MLNYLVAAAIFVAVTAVLATWLVVRERNKRRMPSLNSLRDVNRRGAQRTLIRARTHDTSEAALKGMMSDLKAG